MIIIVLFSSFKGNSYFPSQFLVKPPEHASALLAFRFPMNFIGSNIFIGNTGGGITLLNTRITVVGELLLESNTAMVGGGIAMEDTCLVSTHIPSHYALAGPASSPLHVS